MANVYGRQVIIPLTNKSGGSVIAGDVVIVDTATNESFTTTTSAGSILAIGIAQETIASNISGRVLVSGYAALVNVNASVTRGNFGKTHTVAKQATDAGASRAAGTFCRFLTSGTTPSALVYPVDLAGAALTNPMTTAEDVIVGGASGTPARLAIGAVGGALSRINGVVAWNSGTSFPGSKATGDRYWRSDLGYEAFWDGTRWLTTHEYDFSGRTETAGGIAAAGGAQTILRIAVPSDYDLYVTRVDCAVFVSTTNNATNFWTVNWTKWDTANAATSSAIGNTSANSANTWYPKGLAVNTVYANATNPAIGLIATPTLTPGSLFVAFTARGRLVLT